MLLITYSWKIWKQTWQTLRETRLWLCQIPCKQTHGHEYNTQPHIVGENLKMHLKSKLLPSRQQRFMVEPISASITAYLTSGETLHLYRRFLLVQLRLASKIPTQGQNAKEKKKYHFIFMKVAPGFYTSILLSASVVMEIFAWSLTFLHV